MSFNRRKALISISALAGLLSGCGNIYASRNYKLTFEFTIEDEKRSYSVVQRVETHSYNKFIYGDTAQTKAYGEGIVIDLGDQGKIFSILRFPVFYRDVQQVKYAYSDKMLVRLGLADGGGHLNHVHGPYTVPFIDVPGLVMFEDLNNPSSVTAIDPTRLPSKLRSTVSLDRVSVEFTWAPVTKGEIEKYLPWLKGKQTANNLDGTIGGTSLLPYSLAREITFSDFKREA